MRVFCFHHAGGNPAIFRTWQRVLGPMFDVMPVHFPARERFRTLDDLVTAIHEDLEPHLHERFAFFGHSFGAMIAYRLATRLTEAPQALCVSAIAPPPHITPLAGDLGDDRLADVLAQLGGLGGEITEWRGLYEQAVKSARDDLAVLRTDSGVPTVLDVPIFAFGGEADPLVGELELARWQSLTSRAFELHLLAGGHFFLTEPHELLRRLKRCLLTPAVRRAC